MQLSRKFARALTAALGMCAAAAAMADAGAKTDVLVRFVNHEVLTEQDLSDFLDRRIDMRQASRSAWGVKTALRDLALGRALVLEGEALGVPKAGGQEKKRFDEAYSFAVYKKLAPACEPPADTAAARQFFDATPQAFRVPPMERLERIILPVTKTIDGQHAGEWLMQQAQAIGSGTRKFDDVAKHAGEVYTLEPQGDIGWVTLTDEMTLLRALADAKAGDMVGPVHEGNFVYLFSVVAKREAQQLAWSDAAASAPSRMVSYCRQQGNKQLEERMFAKYGVELDDAAIRGLFNREQFDKK